MFCGCLTQVRLRAHDACTKELTNAIVGDVRIPKGDDEITPDHLPIFAGWQRRIDVLLNRTPPAMDPRIPLPTGDIEIPEAVDRAVPST